MRLETKYAYGSDRIGIEYFAVFYIPHDTLQFTLGTESSKYRPYIGGIDSFIVANIHDHNDPQHWDIRYRYQYSSTTDIVYVSVPKSYMIAHKIEYVSLSKWWSNMYLRYFRP